MLSWINLFILKNPSVLISKMVFKGVFPLFLMLLQRIIPHVLNILHLQHRAEVIREIVRKGKQKRMGKQEAEKWWDLPMSRVFGMDQPLCDAFWVMGTLLSCVFCYSKPFWFSWRSCLRNWGAEGFAVGIVSRTFRDSLIGGIWSWLV